MSNNFQYPSINVRPDTIDELILVSILWSFTYFLLWYEITYRENLGYTRNKRIYDIDAVLKAVQDYSGKLDKKFCGKQEHPTTINAEKASYEINGCGFAPNVIYIDNFAI